MGDPENPRQTLLDLGNVGVRIEGHQDPAGNPPRLLDTTICKRGVEITAESVLEVVPVALLEPELVVMDDEETIHVKDYRQGGELA